MQDVAYVLLAVDGKIKFSREAVAFSFHYWAQFEGIYGGNDIPLKNHLVYFLSLSSSSRLGC